MIFNKPCIFNLLALHFGSSMFHVIIMHKDLQVHSESGGAKLNHYHDANDLEIDAIIEFGTQWAGLEIKLGAHNVEEGASALNRLRKKVCSNGVPQPAFLGVVTGGGPLYTRDDGIHVLPIDCLKP